MSEKYIGKTFYGSPIYDGDMIIRTPSGHSIFLEELERYVLNEDDFEVKFADYEAIMKDLKLEHADQIVERRKSEL